MTNSEPLPTADPADLAEQTTPVDDTATDDEDAAMDAADAPLDTNPADYRDQHTTVELPEQEYPNGRA